MASVPVGPRAAGDNNQCAVTRCRKAAELGDKASANCVRLCMWVRRNTCET